MSERQFNQRVDASFQVIEDAVDRINEDCDTDIDCDARGGVLTLTFENGRKLIFSRQAPLEQLWLATPMGGLHFHWRAGAWRDVRHEEQLTAVFNRLVSEMLAQAVHVDLHIDDAHEGKI